MIEITNFTKKFGDRFIYDNVSFSLPNNGVVAIVGASGSGKTTFLNALAGLDFDYGGSIMIDSVDLRTLSPNSLCDYRIHNIGYVFQNFNLINLETVERNILLPLECTSNHSKKIKHHKIQEISCLLGISKLLDKDVNKLSGGEKQRVAIARAMINSPKLILCDEPTGSLDETNSLQIYNILRKISSNSLIIIASHDIDGVSKIADKIITLKDAKISIKDNKYLAEHEQLPMPENKQVIEKATLPTAFKIKHSFQKIKAKKFRSIITHLMLSLSLTGIGLSLIISNNVSNKIQNAFEGLVNGNQIIMSLKQESQNTFTNVYSAPYKQIEKVYDKYSYYINGVGVNYLVNFEDFFKDNNIISISDDKHKVYIPSLSARSFNEFRWLEDSGQEDYLYSLDNDELILGLNYADMVNLCFGLKIERNYTSLSKYISSHDLFLTLDVENKDWWYNDEQIFRVHSAIESNKTVLYHSNNLWNEEVFEKMMRMPSDDDENHNFPWEMLKLYYFKTIEEPQIFLNSIMFDDEFQDLVFERIDYRYSPLLCEPNEPCSERRVFIYVVDKNAVNPAHIEYISKLDSNIKDYYFISDFGYASYSSNVMSGFAKNIFVSLDETKIRSAIDADNELDGQTNISLDLPDDVVQGNFLNGISNGVRFSTKMDKLINGRIPKNINEIAISKGLAETIDPKELAIGKYLYIAGENNEYIDENKKLNKEYALTKVVVTGIIDEEKNYLYNDNLWTISFFRDKLGVSNFLLIPKAVVIELDQNVDPNDAIERFGKMFHDYTFASPINELTKSVDSTLEFANAILIGFSILSTFISILLLGTVVLLNVLESKDEIKLFETIGVKRKEINSMFVIQSLLQGMAAFIISAFEILIVDYVISLALENSLHVSLKYSLNIVPITFVFAFAVIIPTFVSVIITKFLFRKRTNSIAKLTINC